MTSSEASLSHPKYRPDIDGLRAVAVLSVVAFHAFPGLIRGGFIGVDIFFVISGFLISTIIFENLDRGTFSFRSFYARRIKRIYPVLLLVLAACYAIGWFALLAGEYKQLGKHIAGGAGFVSNLVLWGEAGYFDTSAETKPLLHLWSLGIEEQFYIVWPLLLWAAWRRRFGVLALLLAAGVASFALNLHGINEDGVATFYSPLTRFWELLCGSLLAWLTLYRPAAGNAVGESVAAGLSRAGLACPTGRLADVLSCTGLVLIVFGFWRIHRDSGFPGAWAAIPVAGAVLIIAAGTRAWINRTVLSHPLAVWFGLISFPLYLWHWPLLAFARIVENQTPGKGIRLAAVAVAIVLAWLSWRWVERPLRFGGHGGIKVAALSMLMVLVGGLGFVTYREDGFGFRPRDVALEQQLAQLAWSDDQNQQSACVGKYGTRFGNYCLIKDVARPPEVVLLGDSNANHLFEGLSAAVGNSNLLMIGQSGCVPFIGVSVRLAEGELHCQDTLAPALQYIAETPSVRTVVVSMMGAAYINNKRTFNGGIADLHTVEEDAITDRAAIFAAGMRRTLAHLLAQGKEVVFVVSTPRLNFNPSTCLGARPLSLSARKPMQPCAIPLAQEAQDSKAYLDVIAEVLKEFPAVRTLDTRKALCDRSYCYAMLDGDLLYRDDVHLSVAGSRFIGRAFADLAVAGAPRRDRLIAGGRFR